MRQTEGARRGENVRERIAARKRTGFLALAEALGSLEPVIPVGILRRNSDEAGGCSRAGVVHGAFV